MSTDVFLFSDITSTAIDGGYWAGLLDERCGGQAGAVVSFLGVVRNHDQGRQVTRLDYSAHPDAGRVLDRVLSQAVNDAHAVGVRGVIAIHRVGELRVGEVALGVWVAADHRGAGFQVCQGIVDEIKVSLPVWKKQYFGDQGSEWVGL